MENKTTSEIINDIEDTFNTLNKTISTINEDQIDINPSDGSWSVGKTAEHILLSTNGIDKLFKENIQKTNGDFDGKIPALRSLFLDFSIKMDAPDEILPKKEKHEKKDILENNEAIKNEIVLAATNLDLSVTCLKYEFPGFGYMTRLEWIYFFLFHTQRHTFQIQNTLFKI